MPTSQEKGSVRMGPVTLIALVIILCLSVMAVLSITTSKANYAQSTRQADSVTAFYSNEKSGQELLALVDAELEKAQVQGKSADDAMSAISQAIPSTAVVSGRTVKAAYATQTGHLLNIVLEINDDMTYTITKWKATTEWDLNYEDVDSLWSGL